MYHRNLGKAAGFAPDHRKALHIYTTHHAHKDKAFEILWLTRRHPVAAITAVVWGSSVPYEMLLFGSVDAEQCQNALFWKHLTDQGQSAVTRRVRT